MKRAGKKLICLTAAMLLVQTVGEFAAGSTVQNVYAAELSADLAEQSTEPSVTEQLITEQIEEAPETETPETETPETEPPETEAPETEPPETEAPETEPPETEAPEEESNEGEQSGIYLEIDSKHAYEGMEQSFDKGYLPRVKDGIFELVVPFTSSGKLKEDKLTVNLEFQDQTNTPFEQKNYQKDVKKEVFTFENEQVETYLYRIEGKLLSNAVPGQYTVKVKAWGYAEDGKKVTLKRSLVIHVPEPDPNAKPEGGKSGAAKGGFSGGGGSAGGGEKEEIIHQPRMLLSSCSLNGKEIPVGGSGDLKAVLQNRSNTQSMYNLKIVLSTETPGVNLEQKSFYFSQVGPGEEISLEDKVRIAPETTDPETVITFNFEYEDRKGTAVKGEEKTDFRISQPVRMELEAGEMPPVLFASDTVEIPVKALNLSRTEVYNVKVRLEAGGLFPTEEVFLGNMEAGTGQEGNLKIYVGTKTMTAIGIEEGTSDSEKYGPVKGNLILEYEDAKGKSYEIAREFQTEIKKAEILSLKVEEEKETNDWELSIFVIVVMALTLLIILLGLRLRKNRILLEELRKELVK